MRQIQLLDQDGQVLDIYTIDPVSSVGSSQSGETVDLPQTGADTRRTTAFLLGALLLIVLGICAMKKSGLWK